MPATMEPLRKNASNLVHKRDSYDGSLEARNLTKATSYYDDVDDHEPAEEPDDDPDAKDAKAARSRFMTNEERVDLLDSMVRGYEADDSESSDLSDRSDLSHLSDVEMPDAPEGSVQEYGADDSESDDGSGYENTSDQETTDATDQLDEEGDHRATRPDMVGSAAIEMSVVPREELGLARVPRRVTYRLSPGNYITHVPAGLIADSQWETYRTKRLHGTLKPARPLPGGRDAGAPALYRDFESSPLPTEPDEAVFMDPMRWKKGHPVPGGLFQPWFVVEGEFYEHEAQTLTPAKREKFINQHASTDQRLDQPAAFITWLNRDGALISEEVEAGETTNRDGDAHRREKHRSIGDFLIEGNSDDEEQQPAELFDVDRLIAKMAHVDLDDAQKIDSDIMAALKKEEMVSLALSDEDEQNMILKLYRNEKKPKGTPRIQRLFLPADEKLLSAPTHFGRRREVELVSTHASIKTTGPP
ncbi:hypothetical protein FDECE_11515 [Fusarium decemcellulare]|nr:hypothetical protein FDECE_11515 [Fusarium decemcellulare]